MPKLEKIQPNAYVHNKSESTNKFNRQYKSKVDKQLIVTVP